MKLMPIGFSRRVAEGSRSSWLQTLGNQVIDFPHVLGILTANTTHWLAKRQLKYFNSFSIKLQYFI